MVRIFPTGSGRSVILAAAVVATGQAWGANSAQPIGPLDLRATATASQSSDADASRSASKATDGDPATFSQTGDAPGSFWRLTLDEARPIHRVELVNRNDATAARMAGLTLRILDDQSNTVASAQIANPGRGAVWGITLPAGTRGRFVWVGLDPAAVNGAGDHVVSLAEVSLFTAPNLALGREAYAVRFLDSLPPASLGNDGDYATEFKSTDKSVDAYWETDLGETFALSSVRVVAAQGFTARLAHATVRLFDANHDSVFAQHLRGASPTFDLTLDGPVLARYVRVGFENKERSDPAGGIEWYLGLKEVQAFGRPAAEVGLLAFTASTTQLDAGASATLSWRSSYLDALELYPLVGSVDAYTDQDGSGVLTLTPARTTEYILVGTDRNGAQTRALTLDIAGQTLPVQISEFVANNRLSLEDGRGESPDWIELHNPNNHAVNLAGHGLSDDPTRPMDWQFPSVEIPPHGHFIVFASGRNAPLDAAGFLHADFQLEQDGESVVLTAPDGVTVLDSFPAYPAQREDLAYGRTLDGGLAFLDPTPGQPNLAPAYVGWLPPLAFSHERGFRTNAFVLDLTHPDPLAEVFYTVGGREPTTRYTAPLPIPSTTCVRAAVRRPGFKAPRVQTHTYVFADQVIAAPNMNKTITQDPRYRDRIRQGLFDLPTLCVTVPQLPDDYVEREASVEIFWPDGARPTQSNGGLARFGGAWTTFAKKNYRLTFRKVYGADKLQAPLFRGFDRGILVAEAFDEIDLVGGSHDMVDRGFYMAGRFTEDTMLDMGSLNPHGRFVHLYLNGTYWGQYHARERLTDAFLADYLGGRREDYVNVRGNDNVGSEFILGTPAPPHRQPWERVRALSSSYGAVRPYLDVTHFIDFLLMWGYGNAETEYRAAGPLEAGTGFKFWLGDADGYLRTSALSKDPLPNAGPGNLFGALLAERHPDFMTLLADRIQRHLFQGGALTPARNLERLDARMLEITNSLLAECARWNVRTPANWEAAAQTIRTGLFPERTRNLFNALRSRGLYPVVDPPALNQPGGSVTNGFAVTLSAGAGTIYYTLDGSDPRLPGGDVSPTATPLPSSQSTLVPRGSAWRYWDRGSFPGAIWTLRSFSDEAWPIGNAELGYGDGGEVTVLSFGPNAQQKYPTSYFRHAFTVPDPAALTHLVLELVRDDGAVVYLNGHELVRDNLPEGPIQYATLAASAVGGADESRVFTFTVPATNLVAGPNVLAVEVHQATANSSDLSFDLALSAPLSAPTPELVLERDTRLRARVKNGTTWSALIEADFLLAQRHPFVGDDTDLLITEIHYNPDGDDDYEFIELFNRGTNLLDLTGARLEGAVEFLFPGGFLLSPGAFTLVVEDLKAFAARYQDPNSPWHYPALNVAGQWSGRLDDSGERIALLTSNLIETLAVPYRATGAWPGRADGRGSSLELRAARSVPTNYLERSALLARGDAWRSSALYHGSPGRLDDYDRPLVIHEVSPATEGDVSAGWLELHNPGADDADLFGLFLSDRYDRPWRYAFPEGSVLPAGGFLVLDPSQLGFSLNARGSDLLLVQASGTNLVRFVDTVDYTAVARGETVGRFTRSDGLVDFTELRAPTPRAGNALPRVGPVVFSEIHYRPAPGYAEFVELVNVTPTPILLNDPEIPGSAWSLAGAVQFDFPPGSVLPPCVPIVVSSSDPATFRAQYQLDVNIPVFGPWTGLLDNAGESLRLTRPGEPGSDGTRLSYRVDRVRYQPPAAGSPTENLSGVSLERLTLEAYGNDPAYWRPSLEGPTPGQVSGNHPPTLDLAGPTTITEGETVVLQLQAADLDAPWQIATIESAALPPGAVFDPANGGLSWRTSEADGPGTHHFEFIARDSAACGEASVHSFSVTVLEANQPPVLPRLPDVRYPADTPFRLRIEATDSDLPPQRLTFTQTGLPASLELDALTGWITGRATALGPHRIVLSVTDDQGPPLAAEASFTLTVTPSLALRMVSGTTELPRRFQFPGLAGYAYEIEYSDLLVPADWQLIERIEPAADGLNEFTDPQPPAGPSRFYRVRWLDASP